MLAELLLLIAAPVLGAEGPGPGASAGAIGGSLTVLAGRGDVLPVPMLELHGAWGLDGADVVLEASTVAVATRLELGPRLRLGHAGGWAFAGELLAGGMLLVGWDARDHLAFDGLAGLVPGVLASRNGWTLGLDVPIVSWLGSREAMHLFPVARPWVVFEADSGAFLRAEVAVAKPLGVLPTIAVGWTF